jgi:hypothetical protein
MANVNMANVHESVITYKNISTPYISFDWKQKVKKLLINLQQYDNFNKE